PAVDEVATDGAEEPAVEATELAVEKANVQTPAPVAEAVVEEPVADTAVVEPTAEQAKSAAEEPVSVVVDEPAAESTDEEYVVVAEAVVPRDLAVSESTEAPISTAVEPVPGRPSAPSRLDDSDEHIAPVVVGTIEALELQAVTAQAPDDSAATIQAAQEPANWNSPQSQVSYNRTDSQLSLSDAPDTSAPTDGCDISGRDSAVYMDGASGNQTPDESPVEAPKVPEEAQLVGDSPDQTVPEPEPQVESTSQQAPPQQHSAFSTPAFPQYFTHSEAAQQQQVGAGVASREIPRASASVARKVSASSLRRPKDVLMELNIETPSDGRQLLQLRMTDDLDEVCEEFCAAHGMVDLLPGMKALVRGKVERRLARRRERALQAAVAPGGRYAAQ
ncbi:hypothetical protein GGI20_005345, partial [Coemansia sp. BCRC 34301]